MTRLLRHTVAVSAIAALGVLSVAAEELCSLKSASYSSPKHLFPEAMTALETVEKAGVATWYTDRASSGDYAATAKKLVETCPTSSRLNVVVYGMPNKDCEAGASTGGSRNTNRAEYAAFVQTLADTVGDRKALYVLEPDALGLIAKEDGCGDRMGYMPNLVKAIEVLSRNPNAEIYVDTGYWALEYPGSTGRVVTVLKELELAGRLKGIALNTANYRSTVAMAELCSTFQDAMGSTDLHCVVDTSRNFESVETSASAEWCNLKSAGMGHPPTDNTGYSNLDYFLWLKPAGESDGECTDRTGDAMAGPGAGEFFYDGFKALWNQGYFVKTLGMAKIGEMASPTPAPTTPMVTPAPTTIEPSMEPTPMPTVSPVPTTMEPMPTPTPAATTTTEAPIFQQPITTAPTEPSVGGDDDQNPIQAAPTESPIGGAATTKPTPAPTQPSPTPAASRFRDTQPPIAVTAASLESEDSFGKRLLNGVVIFFVGAVAVLGAVIMINRARANRLKQAMYYKNDSFAGEHVAYTPGSMLELSPANNFRAL